jgi:hypothetical protein
VGLAKRAGHFKSSVSLMLDEVLVIDNRIW